MSQIRLDSVMLKNNHSSAGNFSFGGGIFAHNSQLIFENNTIIQDTTSPVSFTFGGGICVFNPGPGFSINIQDVIILINIILNN